MGISKRAEKALRMPGSKQNQATQDAKSKPKKATYEGNKKKEVGVADLTLINKVTNEAINENLQLRFKAAVIYTYIGHVLVSVNPFRDLGIYTEEVLNSYRKKNRLEMPPHVFAVAEGAYSNMKGYAENQCVIISGESGAGKTEAAKRIMQYIASVSEGRNTQIQEVKEMVLATNPLLEAFGNAKTLRNNNSSRFGKYLSLQFNSNGEPVGADITNYLLEKSRVVGQIGGERNFHIFYQFTKGASEEYRQIYGIQKPETYLYTSASKCFDVDGIDDLAEYRDTLSAMKTIGLAKQEQDEIFRMLAAVLWTGNITFREDKDGYAEVKDQSVVDFLAYLLEVDPAHLIKAITIRILTPRNGEIIESPANPSQAMATRDALAKAIYNNLFDWIVARVNISLQAREQAATSIGILDIYGFEIFEKNSFEQLCINYVNEKLQQIFIQLTLKTEQEEYAREQITWTPISYFDNKIVCDLIESTRPPGIFSAMKDATKTAHADPAACDRTFMTAINGMSNAHLAARSGSFIIKHYAGDVNYSVDGITDKNKDQLLKGLLNLFPQSGNQFLNSLFPNQVDQDNRKQPPSAGDKIKASANDLVATLMKATPSYIRTIKPNENKSPQEYNNPNVLHQIKYLGLQENVRIRRAGFAYRSTYERFVQHFMLLSPATCYAGDYIWTGDDRSGALQILKDSGIPKDEYQMGTTKAFIKSPETLFSLEAMREKYWDRMAIRIQRMWRAYLRIRIEAATRIQRKFRSTRAGARYMALRDKGHKLLQNRKERRRNSLLGYRRFAGDYLGLSSNNSLFRSVAAAVNALEPVVFSCSGEMLESRFGRSSLVSPRTIVLTKSKLYLVAERVVQKQLQYVADKVVPLASIKYVSVSMCRDDWFSLGIGSPQEPDPLTNCIFKTELFTHMSLVMPGFQIKINEAIEFAKKPGKIVKIQVVKDSTQHDDFYKSATVHTHPGAPPNSISKPTPRGKPKPPRPFIKGKLIKPGGPNGRPSRIQPTRVSKPVSAGPSHANSTADRSFASPAIAPSQMRQSSSTSSTTPAVIRAPPPPPPPPPAVAAPPPQRVPKWKAEYDFTGNSATEIASLKAGELVTVLRIEENGWTEVRNAAGQQGWAPTSYLKEVKEEAPPPPPPVAARPQPPAPPIATASKPARNANGMSNPAIRAKPTPPAPPKRPTTGRKPAPAPPVATRDSGLGLGKNVNGNGDVGRDSPTPSLAGGLAEALRARQSAMQGKRNDEDDW